jgi:hypothetical protein
MPIPCPITVNPLLVLEDNPADCHSRSFSVDVEWSAELETGIQGINLPKAQRVAHSVSKQTQNA